MSEEAINERKTSVSMRVIAERCGVNQSTVQRALTGHPKIKAETVARIRQVADELGYSPARHHVARRMVARWLGKRVLNNVVAVFFPDMISVSPYFYRIFLGIAGMAKELHFDLLTVVDNDFTGRELPHSLVRGEVDGAIFCLPNLVSSVIERIRKEQQDDEWPMVSLVHNADCSLVLADDAAGGYQSVSHLLDLGHRHLLHFIPPAHRRDLISEQRFAGYQRACLDRGIDPSQCLHLADEKALGFTVSPESDTCIPHLLDQLARHPEITAILARNDGMAFALATELRRAGYRIPEDMSLVGFDDSMLLPESHGEPWLSTVQVPLEEIGREAMRFIVDRINGRISSDRQIILPLSFAARASTAPPSSCRG